jgi:hypothetical protein
MPDAPADSPLRSDKENKLVELSKQYNKGLAEKDVVLGKLEPLLAENVVYHADEVTLQESIKGRKEVLKYIQVYFDNFDYERVECFGAVNDQENIAFSVSVDKGVQPKEGVLADQKAKGEVKPSNVINLTALVFDKNDQVAEIYAARQLSYDEAHRKLKNVPEYSGSSFNPEKLADDESPEPSEERRQLLKSAASDWNKLFCTNEVAIADKICSPSIKVHNLLVSQETDGLQAWKDSLAAMFKEWECKSNKSRIAVTAGNKAFILWETNGVSKGKDSSVWGISVLLFDDQKIKEAAAIYQPFPGMKEALVKAS